MPEKPMPPAEAIECLAQYKRTGDVRYRNKVMEGNDGMLIVLVNQQRFKFDNIDIQDLLQEARIGFARGLEKFDIDRKDERGRSKPAVYAYKYAEGAVLAFIRLHGHNIPIPDNCYRAYKLMMERVKVAENEHQTENLAPANLIEDQQPYRQFGALAIMNRGYAAPDEVDDIADSYNGYSRSDYTKVLHQLAILPEPQRSVCIAHFGLGEETLPEVHRRTGFTEQMTTRIVQGCIQRIRRSIAEQSTDYTPPNPRERMFFVATQATLFAETSKRGPKVAKAKVGRQRVPM